MTDEAKRSDEEKTCLHCGAAPLTCNVMVASSKNVKTGLMYRKARILADFEQLLADVCQQCGTVNRLHVEDTERDWLKK